MGAGSISNWMKKLPKVNVMKIKELKNLLNEFG